MMNASQTGLAREFRKVNFLDVNKTENLRDAE